MNQLLRSRFMDCKIVLFLLAPVPSFNRHRSYHLYWQQWLQTGLLTNPKFRPKQQAGFEEMEILLENFKEQVLKPQNLAKNYQLFKQGVWKSCCLQHLFSRPPTWPGKAPCRRGPSFPQDGMFWAITISVFLEAFLKKINIYSEIWHESKVMSFWMICFKKSKYRSPWKSPSWSLWPLYMLCSWHHFSYRWSVASIRSLSRLS